jgi:hypothetical protein
MSIYRRTTRTWLTALLAALLLSWTQPVAVACDDQSPEEKLCSDIDDLASALKSIEDVRPESAREDLQKIREDVQEAATDIQQSASEVPEIQDLKDAIDRFRATVESLPENVTAEQAIRTLGQPLIDVSAALANARDALNC